VDDASVATDAADASQGLRACGNRTLAFPRIARAYIFSISTIRNKSRLALRYNPVSQIQVIPQ
jgi:hypothetical protein